MHSPAQQSKTGPRRPEMARKKALSIAQRAMHQRRASEHEKSIDTNGKHSTKFPEFFERCRDDHGRSPESPAKRRTQQSTTFTFGGRRGRPLTTKRSPGSDHMGHERTEHERGSEGGSRRSVENGRRKPPRRPQMYTKITWL